MFSGRNFARFFRYGLTGVLTTTVSFGTFWMLIYLLHLEANTANIIAVACAVVFAYFANKLFVFQSRCAGSLELLREITLFFASRSLSMLAEIAGLFMFYTLLKLDPMVSKIIAATVVLLMNYLFLRHHSFKRMEGQKRLVCKRYLI